MMCSISTFGYFFQQEKCVLKPKIHQLVITVLKSGAVIFTDVLSYDKHKIHSKLNFVPLRVQFCAEF
jgi:hypothetical protein